MTAKELLIKGYLDRISEKFKISIDDAFEVFSIATILDKSFDEIFNDIIITDPKTRKSGSQDGGIDGIYFEEIGSQYNMYVFQCKNKQTLSQNDLDKFKSNFEDIFIRGLEKNNTEHLKPKIEEYKDLTNKGYIINHQLYFLYNGLKDNNQTPNKRLTELYNIGNFIILDSENLYDKVSKIIKSQKRREIIQFVFNPVKSNVVFNDLQALYSYTIENVKALNFRIKTLELCELIALEIEKNGTLETLYSENIRGFLGFKAKPNLKMQNTLEDNNKKYYFPFLNNGLTLICDELIIPPNQQAGKYLVQTKNPVIVNGLQTSMVLWDFYKKDKEKLENVYVNIRIYESTDKDLINLITDATNTQSPINFKDKISNQDFNSITKELFANHKINYLIKRGETFNNINTFSNESIHNETILKFWYASYYEKPEIAKNSISKVLEDIYDASKTTNHHLYELFNGNKNSIIYKQLLQSYYFYKYIQKKKKEESKKEGLKYFHLPYSDELLAYGMYQALTNKEELKEYLEEEYKISNNTCIDILMEEMEKYEFQGKPFSIASYFKKPNCRIDYNRKLNILEL